MAHDTHAEQEEENGHGHDHGDLMDELISHFEPVLDNAADGVYLWIDDDNMVCNEKLAKMFGYTPQEWSDVEDFLGTFVAPEDREMFAEHYGKHIGHLHGPVRFRFKALRKDGKTFTAETDMVPITFGGHAVAYHFVRQV